MSSIQRPMGSITGWGISKEVGPAGLQGSLISFPLKHIPKPCLLSFSPDIPWVEGPSPLTHVDGSLTR